MLVVLAPAAWAQTSVRVVATDPGAEATLGRDESFYVRIKLGGASAIAMGALAFFKWLAGRGQTETDTD